MVVLKLIISKLFIQLFEYHHCPFLKILGRNRFSIQSFCTNNQIVPCNFVSNCPAILKDRTMDNELIYVPNNQSNQSKFSNRTQGRIRRGGGGKWVITPSQIKKLGPPCLYYIKIMPSPSKKSWTSLKEHKAFGNGVLNFGYLCNLQPNIPSIP